MALLRDSDFQVMLADEGLSLRHARFTESKLDEVYEAFGRAATGAQYRIGAAPANPQFAKLRNSRFAPAANHNVIAKAITGRRALKLCVTLQGQIDDRAGGGGRSLVEQYILNRQAAGLIPNPDNPTGAELANLHVNGPTFLARHGIHTMKNQFEHNIVQLCDRVFADWKDINDVFFPNLTLVRLAKISVLDSDPHKGGKRVCRLDFEAIEDNPAPPPQGWFARFRRGANAHNQLNADPILVVPLIYKPSDLELDYRMVCDTQHVRANVQNPALLPVAPNNNRSLFEFLNASGRFVPPLPTYPILPRNCGSQLAADPNGNFDFSNTYGYLKFLNHEPKRTNDLAGQPILTDSDGNAKQLKDYKPSELDWITSDPADVENYFKTMGHYMAVGLIVGFQDSHQGNVMVSGKRPYLVDLEICMKSRVRAVFETMLDAALEKCTDNHGGRFYSHLYFARNQKPPTGHGVYLNGPRLLRAKNDEHWGAVLARAFVEGIQALTALHGNLTNWIGDANLGNTFARITVEATPRYFEYRDSLFGSANCMNPVPDTGNFASASWNNDPFLGWWRNRSEGGINGWITTWQLGKAPRWCTTRPEHNFVDLVQMDIPAYYHRIGTRALYNTRGRLVNLNLPTIPPGAVIPLVLPAVFPRDLFGDPNDVDNVSFQNKSADLSNYRGQHGDHYFRQASSAFVLDMINDLVALGAAAHFGNVAPDGTATGLAAGVKGFVSQINVTSPPGV